MAAFARLATLALRDFRNFERSDLEFEETGAVIVGDNGHGKTNLLEAIAYLGTLRSVRAARDRDLVRHGASAFHARATVDTDTRRQIAIGVDRTSGRKRITVDGVETARQVDALGLLPSVSWSPADVALVAGAPAERRRYLDIMLALSSRQYVEALRHYRAALERRNAALRDAARNGKSVSGASAWESALAQHGAGLVVARRAWVDEHRGEFARLCRTVGEIGAVTLDYATTIPPSDDTRDALAAMLRDARTRDAQRGMTTVGPHRDDLAIAIDARDARTFGSSGQQRTAGIALRLLEARTLRAATGSHPLLLLDDPFAELDATRTARTLELLAHDGAGQVVLAVPRADEIPAHFARLARWRMRAGTVTT